MTGRTIQKLLDLLADGEFHSGQALGKELRVSRAAVWKSIQRLGELGLNITTLNGKGYRIEGGIQLLQHDIIMAFLDPLYHPYLHKLNILKTVTSTNDYLLDMARMGIQKNVACFAERQTHGRGRQGRPWIGPFGTNIYFSLLWVFKKDLVELTGLSLVMATAILKTLYLYDETLKESVQLKWPNDILYQNRKLGGTLIEVLAESHNTCQAIIGIGLNTYMSDTAQEHIDQPWIDLYRILKKPIDRNKIAGTLLNETIATIKKYEKEGLKPFIAEWKKHDALAEKKVTVKTPTQIFTGLYKGISDKGELLVQTADNVLHTLLSAEISVKPL